MIQINHFIQVKGTTEVGKTIVITRCFLKFLEKSQLKSLKFLDGGDFIAVIELNGKIIAFISGGNERNSKLAEENYKILCEMYQGEIEICVFATRTQGNGVRFWQEIAKQNNKQEFDEVLEETWIDITVGNQEEISNKKREIVHRLQDNSKTLVNLVEKIYKGKQ